MVIPRLMAVTTELQTIEAIRAGSGELPGISDRFSWSFQSIGETRPDRNPMCEQLSHYVPPTDACLGFCGHPGCSRVAELSGTSRVCDFCLSEDPECSKFRCDGCLPRPSVPCADPMCRHFTCSACLPRPGHHAEDGAAAAADEIHMAIYPVGDELHMSVQANQHPGDAAAYERYGKQWQVLSDEQKTALYPVINGRGAAKARRRHKR